MLHMQYNNSDSWTANPPAVRASPNLPDPDTKWPKKRKGIYILGIVRWSLLRILGLSGNENGNTSVTAGIKSTEPPNSQKGNKSDTQY